MFHAARIIAGIDEAGRGPLAGPVTAACVVLPEGYQHPTITDSKKLSAAKRDKLFPEICEAAVAFSVISVGPRRIEQLNILQATKLAMALAALRVHAQLCRQGWGEKTLHLLIDGNQPIATHFSQETIIKGDSKELCIGAASILAKVTRDRLMERLHEHHPQYGFLEHKGYPTSFHVEQIKEFGPSKVHRRTFAGVREHYAGPQAASVGRARGETRRKISSKAGLPSDQAQFAFEVRRS